MRHADQDLIALLRADARAPVAALARKLGVARSTVQERIRRLERDGVIAGYTVKLGAEVEKRRVRAQVLVKVDAKASDALARSLRANPFVQALYAVSGAYDYVAVVGQDSTEALDAMLDELGRLPGVARTETLVVLATRFER
jgi:DNA-binding Lrp family transcriptional regulator